MYSMQTTRIPGKHHRGKFTCVNTVILMRNNLKYYFNMYSNNSVDKQEMFIQNDFYRRYTI